MAKTPSEKMKDYRAKLRASGLRPVQIWLPDVNAPDFEKQARAQSLRVAGTSGDVEAMAFIEQIEAEDLTPAYDD